MGTRAMSMAGARIAFFASGEDLSAEGGTIAACQLLIEARRERQCGRERRRTQVPAYAVGPSQ
jgi:hypothetical protein